MEWSGIIQVLMSAIDLLIIIFTNKKIRELFSKCRHKKSDQLNKLPQPPPLLHV